MALLRTHVTFHAPSFNTTESREHFINPGNFGDDVARRIMEELKKRGHTVGKELGQEDFGWYFTFRCGSDEHCFVLGYRDETDAEWLGCVERSAGLVASMFGGRKRGISPSALEALDQALGSLAEVNHVRWRYESDFAAGLEEKGAPHPND